MARGIPIDEDFWREHNLRRAKRLGQPCCSLSWASHFLAGMRGDFAVVAHGETDCLSNFPHFEGVSIDRFYSTSVTQPEFAGGRGAEALRRCLKDVIRETRPKAVFVLGMCLTEMGGEDFEAAAREVCRRARVPAVVLRTGGLKDSTQAECADELYAALAALSGRGRRSSSLNLIGLPRLDPSEKGELRAIARASRIRVNGVYPHDASLSDWRAVGRAAASFLVDAALYPKLEAVLDAADIPSFRTPLPAGLAGSLAFFELLGCQAGRLREVRRAIAPLAGSARSALRAFRARFHGRRLAVDIRTSDFSEAGRLGIEGLGELRALREMGLAVTLLIQGPPEGRGRFRKLLSDRGCGLPFEVFPAPSALRRVFASGRFDAAYMRDTARGYAEEAGVPLISDRLRLFFGGLEANLETFERRLAGAKRGGRR